MSELIEYFNSEKKLYQLLSIYLITNLRISNYFIVYNLYCEGLANIFICQITVEKCKSAFVIRILTPYFTAIITSFIKTLKFFLPISLIIYP